MLAVANAQAYAITLEKEGGSATPTLEEMYVMGSI
jgi:anti-sigma-K factor RskA